MLVELPSNKNFMLALMNGEALLEDIDIYINYWHKSSPNNEVYDFLGLSRKEYFMWLEEPETLSLIASARKNRRTIDAEIAIFQSNISLAARGSINDNNQEIIDWLTRTNRV